MGTCKGEDSKLCSKVCLDGGSSCQAHQDCVAWVWDKADAWAKAVLKVDVASYADCTLSYTDAYGQWVSESLDPSIFVDVRAPCCSKGEIGCL
jgi:hypothetical protein